VCTDALGSPIASSTWGNGGLERTRYEPYGATLPGTTVRDGIGYTGHVNDPDTGLVYMQQRYYEPLAGRFLSVDPVTTSAKDGSSFNRYAYAQDNPYKYSDPDGRNPKLAVDFALNVALNLATSGEFGLAAAVTETLIGALNPAKTLQTAVKVGEAVKDAAKGGKSLDVGSPTAFKPVDSATRERILARDRNADGTWTCATCGQRTSNPENVHTGHITPRSKGGDLSDQNLRCEGAACNLSQGDRSAPKPGMTCAERGSCGAPYGRQD
jgi:RHS repeat-associated protein